MAGKRTDLNRQRKVYPYIRRKPVYGFLDVADNVTVVEAEIENVEVSWGNTSSKTYTFTTIFTSIPTVIAVSKNDNINVFVDSVSLTNVTIKASAVSNESFIIHAINIL